jgi:hypothetical protein
MVCLNIIHTESGFPIHITYSIGSESHSVVLSFPSVEIIRNLVQEELAIYDGFIVLGRHIHVVFLFPGCPRTIFEDTNCG